MTTGVFYSTRGNDKPIMAPEAILKGIANDGGLYISKNFPNIPIENVKDLNFKNLAKTILSKFLVGFGQKEISYCVDNAFNSDTFDTDEITPLKKVGDKFVLELFHGRTCAFKDIALSILPYLMSVSMKKLNKKEKIFILTATSGDTGSAALTGFTNVEGIKILVFYPKEGISNIQRLQMTTNEGSNTNACAIYGNFDDAQNGVKKIFTEISPDFCSQNNISLSSANSINIGRLAPQIIYYYDTYNKLVQTNEIKQGDLINFIVPTGNFGDILAGYLAKLFGLPIDKLICASNSNNVLTEFLQTGKYNINRKFLVTLSPSMDILISSNLERLLYIISNFDHKFVSQCMNDLKSKKEYVLPQEYLTKILETFEYGFVDDNETKQIIQKVFNEEGYLLDPHTAVAWKCAEKFKKNNPNKTCVVLSTASPFKFPVTVLSALQKNIPENPLQQLEMLEQIANLPMPIYLKDIFIKNEKFKDIINPNEMFNYVKNEVKNG